jgi:hypothetical protein
MQPRQVSESGSKKFSIRNGAIKLWKGFAQKLNPKIRGWVNYYTKFNRQKAHGIFYYLKGLIQQWMKHKYKITSRKKLCVKYGQYQAANRDLFYHWKLGIKASLDNKSRMKGDFHVRFCESLGLKCPCLLDCLHESILL